MAEEDTHGRWSVEDLPIVACTIGVLLGVSIVQAEFVVSPKSVTASLFEANSGNALRVLQSVGILLPLFVGLLRFTTSDRSEVSERVNNHPLLGILGLVFAGASAVIGGMLTGMSDILELSLLFVLFTFVVIGLAAEAMFGEFTTASSGVEGKMEGNDRDREAEDPKIASSETAGDDVRIEAETESEPESNEEDERTEDATGDEKQL